MAAAVSSPSRRDARIDILRGLALAMIFVDHIAGNFFIRFTYQQFSYSTAAWLFVLLSGISFAYKHSPLLSSKGLAASTTVALKRVQTIYCAHLMTFVASVALLAAVSAWLGGVMDLAKRPGLGLLLSDPLEAIARFAALHYQPMLFDILPLYIVLVALGPFMLWGLRRSARMALGLSFVVYVVVQFVPEVSNFPAWYRARGWPFNPLAWQFLFMLGIAIGSGVLAGPSQQRVQRALFYAALAFVAFAAVSRVLAHIDPVYRLLGGEDAFLLVAPERRDTWLMPMHPVTVLHVLAFIVVLDALVPRDSALVGSRWLAPLAQMGRHSLEVFSVGLILTHACSELFDVLRPSYIGQLGIQSLGILLMWAVARFQDAARRADARPAAHSPFAAPREASAVEGPQERPEAPAAALQLHRPSES